MLSTKLVQDTNNLKNSLKKSSNKKEKKIRINQNKNEISTILTLRINNPITILKDNESDIKTDKKIINIYTTDSCELQNEDKSSFDHNYDINNTDIQNNKKISRTSFNKFDILQKRILHNEKNNEKQVNCFLCGKSVYIMEEIKAEKKIFHKNCFRCHECNKQLKVDNYQSHEGVLFCTIHFKLLFTPKCVNASEEDLPRKPELIIRENQPAKLPSDIVRACDKPNLGLEELTQLNVRSKFQAFERADIVNQIMKDKSTFNTSLTCKSDIKSKMTKFQQQRNSIDMDSNEMEVYNIEKKDSINDNSNNIDNRQDTKKETHIPSIGINSEDINDIRIRFETGQMASKKERREEQKQEIQNIRSRLFLGKQARIKEMYQQAVAESEQKIISAKTDIVVDINAQKLKERFESGDIYSDKYISYCEKNEERKKQDEDVFESAISKKSRRIFMELDANTNSGQHANICTPQTDKLLLLKKCNQRKSYLETDVIRYDEKIEDAKIETSQLSEKFKFFEAMSSIDNKRLNNIVIDTKTISDQNNNQAELKENSITSDINAIKRSCTTLQMLNKFRELEKNISSVNPKGPRPLKCFTPPPEDERCYRSSNESSEFSSEDDENINTYDELNRYSSISKNNRLYTYDDDQALNEAKAAARTKELRIKFEKLQCNSDNEDKSKLSNDYINEYLLHNAAYDTSAETTKTIRERFENMKNMNNKEIPSYPHHEVHRFVDKEKK